MLTSVVVRGKPPPLESEKLSISGQEHVAEVFRNLAETDENNRHAVVKAGAIAEACSFSRA